MGYWGSFLNILEKNGPVLRRHDCSQNPVFGHMMQFGPIKTHLPLDKIDAILAADIFKRIFVNENIRILVQISLKFVPKDLIDNKAA